MPLPLPLLQVMAAILKEAQLPSAAFVYGVNFPCMPAGAAYRMDENITVFAVRNGVLCVCTTVGA